MDAQLPKHITEFFERTTKIIDHRYHPRWLISNFHEPLWKVDVGLEDLREVKGKLRGGIELNWAFRFPGYRFTEEEYAVPLKQAKLILIAGVDCCFTGAGLSKLSIGRLHRFLILYSEYLAVKYGVIFQRQGFQIAELDDVTDFLLNVEAAGVAGTGFYVERWENFLSHNCSDIDPESECVREFLIKDNAYDRYGRIKSDYVANAIEIDYRRLRLSSYMRCYISLYNRKKTEIAERNYSFISQAIDAANCFKVLSEVMRKNVIDSSGWQLSDSHGVIERCKIFRTAQGSRTKTMPPSVSKNLIYRCCRWMIDSAQEIEMFVEKICAKALDISDNSPDLKPMRCLWEAEQVINLPEALLTIKNAGVRTLRLFSKEDSKHSAKFPICFLAVRLHMAVCFMTITLLSCSRRSEILELGKDALLSRNGRYYLSILLRKSGLAGSRLSVRKPVPKLVEQCISSLSRIEANLSKIMRYEDPLSEKRVFFKTSVQRICPLEKDDVIPILSLLSKFLGLLGSDGKEWKLKPHQLRRHFAMTFFHSGGGEDSLPALAWFMGHENISSVWRYVKEDLTGREISEAEAAMATAALFSSDESEGVARLRKIVLEHFGCDEMSVMNEEDTLDYLEMLAERGVFAVQPIQLKTGRRTTVYTILISISEERLHAEIE